MSGYQVVFLAPRAEAVVAFVETGANAATAADTTMIAINSGQQRLNW